MEEDNLFQKDSSPKKKKGISTGYLVVVIILLVSLVRVVKVCVQHPEVNNPLKVSKYCDEGLKLIDDTLRKDEELRYYNQALELDSTYWRAWALKGSWMARNNKKDSAAICLIRSIELMDNGIMATSEDRQRRRAFSIRYLTGVLRSDGQYVDALHWIIIGVKDYPNDDDIKKEYRTCVDELSRDIKQSHYYYEAPGKVEWSESLVLQEAEELRKNQWWNDARKVANAGCTRYPESTMLRQFNVLCYREQIEYMLANCDDSEDLWNMYARAYCDVPEEALLILQKSADMGNAKAIRELERLNAK